MVQQFIEKRLISDQLGFFDVLHKERLQTFTSQAVEKNVMIGNRNVVIKADRSFFCKLVVIAQMRELDLFEVYSHELGPIPWAIATQDGTLHKATKSSLLEDLEKDVPSVGRPPPQSAMIIDAFTSIQVLKKPKQPGEEEEDDANKRKWKPETFGDVAESILSMICNITSPAPAN